MSLEDAYKRYSAAREALAAAILRQSGVEDARKLYLAAREIFAAAVLKRATEITSASSAELSVQDAADLAQVATLKMLEKAEKGEILSSPAGMLRVIITNLRIDRWRNRWTSRRKDLENEEGDAIDLFTSGEKTQEERVIHASELALVETMLSEITPHSAEVIRRLLLKNPPDTIEELIREEAESRRAKGEAVIWKDVQTTVYKRRDHARNQLRHALYQSKKR